MNRKLVIYILAFGISLINALSIVAIGSLGTPAFNNSTSGNEKAFDPGNMDLSVRPGDDFFEYAEGSWIKSHPVPANKSRYGETEIIEDRTYERVRIIVESAASNTSAPEGSLEQKIGEFYRLGMDNVTLDQQRLDPIKDELKLIDNISDISEVQSVSTQMLDYGIDPFFSIYASPDAKNSKVMIAVLTQGGLSLPDRSHQDRDFYLRQDNESIKTRAQYLAHVAQMFSLLGDSPEVAKANARTVMKIETRLARASFNNVDNSDEIKTYNKMSLEELQAFAPGIKWSCLFRSLGQPEVTEVNVRNPSFFKELSNALQDESVADWKTFLRWKMILATAPYLSSDLEQANFEFYQKTLKGQQEMEPRWKRVIDAENGALGEAIGHLYVDRYFDQNSRAKMQEMAANLKTAFRERIQNLTWMEPETKIKALAKLDALDVQVGYPDEWLDYSELEVKHDSYVRNALRAAQFQFHYGPYGIDKIGKPVDRKLWEMNPQEVNAYAEFNKVVVVFPAGILQSHFFNKDFDDAVNYGAIGATIGHEITHHFDSQGRKFDATGNLTDWWSAQDADKFNRSTGVLVYEYDKFEVLPSLNINGNQTLQENIADFGGLTMAYYAYKHSLKKEPEIIDGFTGDQRFFLSYAQSWRESDKNEYLRTLTLSNTHSPVKYRVNGVVFNMPEFYRAFPNVKPGDKLYRPENERPVIW